MIRRPPRSTLPYTTLFRSKPDNPNVLDWLLALVSLVPGIYMVADWQGFFRRAILPTDTDLIIGTLLILLCLEAARRTVGVLVPVVVLLFIASAYYGSVLPSPITTAQIGRAACR